MAVERGWAYGKHYVPHDIRVHEWTSGKTRIQEMLEQVHRRGLGKGVVKVPNHKVEDGIDATRRLLGICQFDAGPCADGIKSLKSYRKDWDDERGVWRDRPRHDAASHGADAFRGLAMTYRDIPPEAEPYTGPLTPQGKPMPWTPRKFLFLYEMTWEQFHEATGTTLDGARRRHERERV